MAECQEREPFRAERTDGEIYWTIFGPDGEVGWGVEYSEFAANSTVYFLTKAFEAGRASVSDAKTGEQNG